MLLCALPPSAFSEEAFPGEKIEVRVEEHGTDAEVWAWNKLGGTITVTFRSDLVNMRADRALPATCSLGGGERTLLARLSRIRRGRAYSYEYRYRWQYGARAAVHDDSVVYRLPYDVDRRFYLMQGYDGRFSHAGLAALDFAMPEGTSIRAARAGVVVDVEGRYREGGVLPELKERANYIRIEHEDGTVAEYYHLRQNGVLVARGAEVAAGQVIGYSGNVGFSSAPHLHFMVTRAVDGEKRVAIRTRFRVADNAVFLQEGRRYRAR